MTQMKIYGHRAHLGPRRAAVSDTLHRAAVQAFTLPEDKRFHRFFLLDEEDFVTPADRDGTYTIIEVLLFTGRSLAAKHAFLTLVFDLFARDLNIEPRNVEVVLLEAPREHWGIRGVTGDQLTLPYQVDV
ncbi:tautomerase family protein [Deinococcus yavapaiensis]|uniref:Phenylpyruvate tautomerase PptA (4-oxalocrotonate tautomerase family) n=1 Tax=Deinococcus yavapaiensis KR-236 TaxID=694435 RepID=A0A318SBP9_9DEIO|nr:tautomerase family protein [Deinococcus yavapaiensis]PYE53780.1 phenylpyruvate tautomerase PptA (4-oxalocrotonate tautomerase family) [Deinococcus yavapaiensis KR-236]